MDGQGSHLYTNLVFGIQQWIIASICAIVSSFVVFIALWRPWNKGLRANRARTRHVLWSTVWLAFAGLVTCIWLASAAREEGGWWKAAALVAAGVFILVTTLFLEGIEIAYTDLSDKDEEQLGASKKAFDRMTRMGEKFYEARGNGASCFWWWWPPLRSIETDIMCPSSQSRWLQIGKVKWFAWA